MYLIEYVHVTKKSKKKEYHLFSDFTEFTDFALKLSMCSNVENIECFDVEFSKKENLKTLSDLTKRNFQLSIKNFREVTGGIVNAR